MHAIRVNQRFFSFQFQLHFPAVFAHLDGHVFDHLADEVVHIQGLLEELHFARFCQTGLQDIFHQHAEPFVLLIDEPDVVVESVGILLHVGILEGFRRQTDGADGGFELVREVVHQIPADPVDAFVAPGADDRGKKAPGNDGQHQPGQGKLPEQVVQQVAPFIGKKEVEAQAVDGHLVHGYRHLFAVFNIGLLQPNGLSIAVKHANGGWDGDAVCLQDYRKDAVDAQGLNAVQHADLFFVQAGTDRSLVADGARTLIRCRERLQVNLQHAR